jgi:hypothetical protein
MGRHNRLLQLGLRMSAAQLSQPEKRTQLVSHQDVTACQQDNQHNQKKERISLDINRLQHVSRIIATR